jgi:hypothetical protein
LSFVLSIFFLCFFCSSNPCSWYFTDTNIQTSLWLLSGRRRCLRQGSTNRDVCSRLPWRPRTHALYPWRTASWGKFLVDHGTSHTSDMVGQCT